MRLIDLMHAGLPRVIGCYQLDDVLVDPGPGSCLPTLLEGLGGQVPRALLLTHIHLDHAGASGALVRRWPDLEVYVHERGAPHLVDPSRLMTSARRLYGDDMDRLWGETLPVPEANLRILSGGERVLGEAFEVAYTPGHASHHVSYLHEPSGRAFTGDVAGVRIGEGAVMAPTPPPDIDLQAWRRSLEEIESWAPRSLALTHFGAHLDVETHLAQLREQLDQAERMARELDEHGYAAAVRARVTGSAGAATAAAYERAMPPAQSYHGLARYLRRPRQA
jgi:glyoxylase-like metal-dependent hydrolase (beta-lactamase superfamily II)